MKKPILFSSNKKMSELYEHFFYRNNKEEQATYRRHDNFKNEQFGK